VGEADAARKPSRLAYLARVVDVYARPGLGPLSFWHETPEMNAAAFDDPRQYYMRFRGKAAYLGPFDRAGVPLLDYRGAIGRQYNPIAIAQYGLALLNRWCEAPTIDDERAWLMASRWLADHLRSNAHGVKVWLHLFDWPYRQMLVAPWYSGLAQGSGLSLLVRAAMMEGDPRFATAADHAFESLQLGVDRGGTSVIDTNGRFWIEEYLVQPPSHVLNGFIWAAWGVHDFARWTGRADAQSLWQRCVDTLEAELPRFDIGWWSLYEAPNDGRRMLASFYYHRLHIVQLQVLHRLTGRAVFADYASRFTTYLGNRAGRARAFAEKSWFKLRHY
jgi:hypothetical protein